MEWIKPEFTRNQVCKAGNLLSDETVSIIDKNWALEVVGNWRSCHALPLNTFQSNLKKKAEKIDSKSIVARRTKRLPSIISKLKRFEHMNLGRMQDIAGCRAIMKTMPMLKELNKVLEKKIRHKVVGKKDYITQPQETGYRGVHLIFRYDSAKRKEFNGLLVEVQLRTKLQHIWSTAVETIGVFLNQPLKSNQGEKDWLRFFALLSGLFAIKEKYPVGPGIPNSRDEILAELMPIAEKLKVEERLNAYRGVVKTATEDTKKAKYFLMKLDPVTKKLELQGFKASDFKIAELRYMAAEASLAPSTETDIALVSVTSINNLKKAYPNYYLDLRDFVSIYRRVIPLARKSTRTV